MTTVPTTLFPCHAVLTVHCVDARQTKHIVATTDDVAFEALVADQIPRASRLSKPLTVPCGPVYAPNYYGQLIGSVIS